MLYIHNFVYKAHDNPRVRYKYHSHFTDEKAEAQGFNNLPKCTQLKDGSGI